MTSAVILAGGSSRRMGSSVDKLMLTFANRPLLAHCLLAFENCPDVDEIILVAREDRKTVYRRLVSEYQITKLVSMETGGAERQDSAWQGILAVSSNSEITLIHDGARALVTGEIISQCIKIARQTGAVIPATRVKDTIKRAHLTNHTTIEATIERSQLWIAQTPQTFRTELIRRAYSPLIKEKKIVTDDAAAVELLGEPVTLVDSDPLNLKITTPDDLLLAELIFSKRAKMALSQKL